jgi:hypothetical protein
VAKREGCLLIKMHHGLVGFPDRLLLRPDGTVAFIEFKSWKGRASPIQKYWLGLLNWMGFKAVIVRTADQFAALLTTTTKSV